jgi:ribosome-associated protein
MDGLAIRSVLITNRSVSVVSGPSTKGDFVVISSARPAEALRTNPGRSWQLALAAARTAAENRGQNIVILDLQDLTAIFDYFVLVTGTSRRQLHAISEEIDHTLQDRLGDRRLNIEGYDESRWIVLDYGNIVVHLFDGETRDYYDLEGLWAEAKRVDLSGLLSEAG